VPVLLFLWVLGGLPAYLMANAYFWREFDTLQSKKTAREDGSFALFWAICGGPIASVLAFFLSGYAKYGVKWTWRDVP
jgi:hypothetical protein